MWVAQGKYISDCATEKSKGFYNGYFWAFYMCSQVIGNLIAGLILGQGGQVSYTIVMTILSLSAAISFFFLRPPKI